MARIAVVTSAPPLMEGGHLAIARALRAALEDAGHEAGIVTTPSNRFGRQIAEYVATWLTDVRTSGGKPIDQVITLRYPAYAVRHPVHVCWLNHTMREYYDLWDDFVSRLSPQGRVKEAVRKRLIRAADTYFLKHHVTTLFAQSRTIRDRLVRWNGVASRVLYPPPPPRPYRCDGYGNFLFFTSRLTPLKRADLVLRALAEPPAQHVSCVIAGEGDERASLQTLARELGVDDRVTFTGYLSDEALVDHLARCRAVVFVPRNEDYGFVTVEAFAARKAVITVTDSGGPAELVRHGENGLVAAPDPAALARACAEISESAGLAERLGTRAHADVAALTWAGVVGQLVVV
jgi:glycosyltransferase involved in cell wall biosynthesis